MEAARLFLFLRLGGTMIASMTMPNVVIIESDNRRKGVRDAVHALGAAFVDKVKAATKILVKVNLVHHENQLASTHVDAVRGLLDEIRLLTRVDVFVGDASYHGTKAAIRNFGYERIPEEYEHTKLVDLNDDETVPGYTVRADGSHNPIRRSKLATDANLRISLTPMKVHRDVGVSLSIKNWTVGTWVVPPRNSAHGSVWARWPWLHEEGVAAHHASIAALYAQLPCDIAIVDGVMAMEGDGPTAGSAVPMGVVLAGTDAVAVDAIGATLMGFDPSEIGYLVKCSEQGLGIADMAKIDAPPLQMEQLRRTFLRPPELAEKLRAGLT